MSDPSSHASNTPGDVRFNALVNILDGAFFGAALGMASFTTVIPLFVRQLTDSAILIGLIPAIHVVGWQLPQLLTANRVRRLSRYKPMILAMTIHERLPFFVLSLLAWSLPGLERNTALVLVFALLIWQGLGGGYAAVVWQSMIGKIIPAAWRGGFFGAQSSAANLGAAITAVAAGQILEHLASPLDFALCFALAGLFMAASFGFLASTREVEHDPAPPPEDGARQWDEIKRILRSDRAFQRFLLIRIILAFGMTAFSYYAVYVVGELGASEALAGWLTGVLILGEVIISPALGAIGDRKGHRLVLLLGSLGALASATLAGWLSTIPAWFLIFILAGAGYAVGWTTTMVLTLEFGNPHNKAIYIGLSNTLVAPAALAAPFLAGWCIEALGYATMFRLAALTFLLAAFLSLSLLQLEAEPFFEG